MLRFKYLYTPICQPEAGFSQDVGGADAQPSARFYATDSEELSLNVALKSIISQ